MEPVEKVRQIVNALQMTDEADSKQFPGQRVRTPTIQGADRTALISELVRLLTEEPASVTP